MTSSTDTLSKPSDQRGAFLIHPMSALLLVAVDALWTLADWAAAAWLVTIPVSFLAVAIPVYAIQRRVKHDPAGRSAAVAATLGVLAAVPTPVMGTVVGATALALAGLRTFPWGRKNS